MRDCATQPRQDYISADELDRRFVKFEARLAESFDIKLAKINDGYPNGDAIKHRIHHEKMISRSRAFNSFKNAIFSKFVGGALWFMAAWIGYVLWEVFKNEVNK